MRLLILTQKADRNDPVLGFFHGWIKAFSGYFKSLTVICLEKGEIDLPANVKVISLGKENNKGEGRMMRSCRLLSYVWNERKNYDAVFVHMNQEYVLLAGWLWKLMGKKIYMWRNHHAGSILTDIAAFFCMRVFCTSKYSYTAKYKKTVLMPVGVDISTFKPVPSVPRVPRSILFLSRMSPAKKPDVFVEMLKRIGRADADFSASIYGDPGQGQEKYFDSVKAAVRDSGFEEKIKIHPGIPNYKAPDIFRAHDIFVNLSSSGMYDKTIFEAMACGCLILASNDNLKGQVRDAFVADSLDPDALKEKMLALFEISADVKERQEAVYELRAFAESHSLDKLASRLSAELGNKI